MEELKLQLVKLVDLVEEDQMMVLQNQVEQEIHHQLVHLKEILVELEELERLKIIMQVVVEEQGLQEQ